jgi:hypothetical protein
VATKHDDSVKGGEFPELTKAVREGDVATALAALLGPAPLGVKRSRGSVLRPAVA